MQNRMGTEKVPKLIMSMALPAMTSMLIQALYNIVDSVFVANYSEQAFAAVTLAYPVQMLIISVAVGTGIGVNSLISRRLGQKRQLDAENAAMNGIMLSVISGVISLVLALTCTAMFYAIFDVSQTTFEMACSYTYVVLGISMFVYVSIIIEKIFQGTGNMLYPMIFNLTGAIINIILDPIFIFGYFGIPSMGVTGAAIATVTGQFCSMCLAIYFLKTRKLPIKLSFKIFKPDFESVKDIYKVGIPAIVMQSVVSFMTTGLNAILAGFSETAVSVLGIYFKLQSFVFMPVFGLTQGFLPVVGYNYGAKNLGRIKEAYKVTLIAAFCIMSLGVFLFNVFPKELISIFTPTDELFSMGVPALRIISLSFFGGAIGIITASGFQAVGYGMMSLIVSLVRQLILILPLAYFLSSIYGVTAVWAAFPMAEYFSIALALMFVRHIYKTDLKFLEEEKTL